MDTTSKRLIMEAWPFILLTTGIVMELSSNVKGEAPGQSVTTQKDVALRKGTRDLIPCQVERDILVVQWKKGSTYFTAKTVAILDMSTQPATKRGPGYMDGSFNINDDYSLIFSDVKLTDEGRYFCDIFDLATGKLFHNHTDVTVFEVAVPDDGLTFHLNTLPNASLRKGGRGVLPCTFNRAVLAVHWNKGPTYFTSETVILLDLHEQVGKKSGPGYDEGSFDIDNEFSLMIPDVKMADDGRYFCSVFDMETERQFHNHTDVSIYAFPDEPFPTIEHCHQADLNGTTDRNCTIISSSALNIMCTVSGYFPHITLYFSHKSVRMKVLSSKEWINTDGTRGMSVTVTASPSHDPYICVATDVPGSDKQESWMTVFFLQEDENNSELISRKQDGSMTPLIIALTLALTMTMIVSVGVGFYIMRRKSNKDMLRGQDDIEMSQPLLPVLPVDELLKCKNHATKGAAILCRDCRNDPFCRMCFDEQHTEHFVVSAKWSNYRESFPLPEDKKGQTHTILRLADGRLAIAYANKGIDIFSFDENNRDRILDDTWINDFDQLTDGNIIITNNDVIGKVYNLNGISLESVVQTNEPKCWISIKVITEDKIITGDTHNNLIIKYNIKDGSQIGKPRKTKIEPRQIYSNPDGFVYFSSGKPGQQCAVYRLKSNEPETPLILGSRERRHFFTCDNKGNIYVASVSSDERMDLAKFSTDGTKLEDIAFRQKLKSKATFIDWISMATISEDNIVIADQERIFFYRKRSSHEE